MAARDFPGPSDHDRQPHQREVTVTTQPTEKIAAPWGPISEMAGAVETLAALIEQHPTLPDAYITVHAPFRGSPSTFDMQLQTATEFEAWREALGIDPAKVALYAPGENSWVGADGHVQDVTVRLTGHALVLTWEQMDQPRTLRPEPGARPLPLAESPTAVCGSQCPEHPEHQCRRSPGHQAGICRDEKQKGTESCTWDPASQTVIV